MNRSSYTAANAFPYKLFKDLDLLESMYYDYKIIPRHVQLSPTNNCNLKCSFCSCDDRDRKLEWSFDDVVSIVNMLTELGTTGVTITGGGEPLLFKYTYELITRLTDAGIKVGLVTNGTRGIANDIFRKLTWCRISFSDERTFDEEFYNNMILLRESSVDMAFSYVLTTKPNYDNLAMIVRFANDHDFTHVRVVSDILDYGASHNISMARHELMFKGVSDALVIYQERCSFIPGVKDCLISLLKPMIYSDGYIYPCCGAQYALFDEKQKMPSRMRMGHYTELPDIINNQRHFDGSICNFCYYRQYNDALKNIIEPIAHEEFI